jgi:uracil-DNA glycosylase
VTIHVPPQWPDKLPTKISFVGEAPSDAELDKGQPLVGPSGRVFNAILRTAGLSRFDYHITNVFDEQLPDNNIASWLGPATEAKAGGWDNLPPVGKLGYLRPEHHHHLDRLAEELARAQPSVIVPLGATALWALTGFSNITSYRGTTLAATRLAPGVKLVPAYHPAHIIHQWKLYSVAVGDFSKAAVEADRGRAIILPKRELLIEPTLQELKDYVPRLLASDLLSVDIETGWGQITSIGFAPDAEHAICVPFVDKRRPDRNYWPTLLEEYEAMECVRTVLESDVPKVGQNYSGYDAYWLWKRWKMATRNLNHDTRLMHHVLYPELPKDLEFMGASYTNQGAWKNWGHNSSAEKRDD